LHKIGKFVVLRSDTHEYVDQDNVGMWLRCTGLIEEAKQVFLCGIWEGTY